MRCSWWGDFFFRNSVLLYKYQITGHQVILIEIIISLFASYQYQVDVVNFHQAKSDIVKFTEMWSAEATYLEKLKVIFSYICCKDIMCTIILLWCLFYSTSFDASQVLDSSVQDGRDLTGLNFWRKTHWIDICKLLFQHSVIRKFPQNQTDGRFLDFIHKMVSATCWLVAPNHADDFNKLSLPIQVWFDSTMAW